jgi:hypothetical protein
MSQPWNLSLHPLLSELAFASLSTMAYMMEVTSRDSGVLGIEGSVTNGACLCKEDLFLQVPIFLEATFW